MLGVEEQGRASGRNVERNWEDYWEGVLCTRDKLWIQACSQPLAALLKRHSVSGSGRTGETVYQTRPAFARMWVCTTEKTYCWKSWWARRNLKKWIPSLSLRNSVLLSWLWSGQNGELCLLHLSPSKADNAEKWGWSSENSAIRLSSHRLLPSSISQLLPNHPELCLNLTPLPCFRMSGWGGRQGSRVGAVKSLC